MSIFHCLPIVMIFALSFKLSISQVNTEALLNPNAETGIRNSLKLQGGLSAGNSEFIMLKGGYRFDFFTGRFHSFFSSSIEYQEGNNELIKSKGFMHLRGMFRVSEIFMPEIFLQKEYNKFTDLNDRNLAGGGIRFHILDIIPADSGSSLDFFIGVGMMYENEVYSSSPEYVTNLLRSTNYLSLFWDDPGRYKIKGVVYFQPELTRFNDHRILSEISIDFNLTTFLSFTVELRYAYDNEPTGNVKKYDLELTNGIRINF